jgi:hypothetical protein
MIEPLHMATVSDSDLHRFHANIAGTPDDMSVKTSAGDQHLGRSERVAQLAPASLEFRAEARRKISAQADARHVEEQMPVHLSHVYPARLAGDDQTRRGFEVVRIPRFELDRSPFRVAGCRAAALP